MNRKQKIGCMLAALAFAALVLLPGAQGLSGEGQRCLALFIAVFILYIFESLPCAVISLAIVPLLVLLRIVDVGAALSGFAASATYLIVGSFILTAAMMKTGLGKRVTCLLLSRVGSSPRRISFGIVLVNILMAFLIPSTTARTAMLLPVCVQLIEQCGGAGRAKARYAANLLLTLCVTSSIISSGILTSTISNPMAVEYILHATGETVSFWRWFVLGFPPALVMTFAGWAVIQLLFRTDARNFTGNGQFAVEQLRALGPMTRGEWYTLAVIGITVLLWILGDRLGVDSTTAALAGAILLCIPGLGVLNWEDCKQNMSLSVVFVCSGGISLGAAMSAVGTSDWLADRLFGFMTGDVSLVMVVIFIIVISQAMHALFVGTATMANAMFPILVSVAMNLHVGAEVTVLPAAFLIAGYPIFTFFNTTPNLLCYDTGYVETADFIKMGIPISILACLVYIFCTIWYWPMVGLL